MAVKYLYNPKTGKLHIEGYCPHARNCCGYLEFETENDAVIYDGRAVGMCKRCQKKREEIEKET